MVTPSNLRVFQRTSGFQLWLHDHTDVETQPQLFEKTEGAALRRAGRTGRRAFACFAMVAALLSASPAFAQSYFNVLHRFTFAEDGGDLSGLIQAGDGNFYGTAEQPDPRRESAGHGVVFRMTPAGAITILYAFPDNGDVLPGQLADGGDGYLYGTAPFRFGAGGIYKLSFDGTLTWLYRFDSVAGATGIDPTGRLLRASDGNFYGTTSGAGPGGGGTVFRMTPAGAVTVLHAFTGPGGSSRPASGVIQASDGNLYGTTVGGSDDDPTRFATIFRVTLAGAFTQLHVFPHGSDFEFPLSPLTQGPDGNLYGASAGSRSDGFGGIYRMTLDGNVTILHVFKGADGRNPTNTALVQDADGSFYGMTIGGGISAYGTIFKITPAGALTTLHNFNFLDGEFPLGSLVRANDGSVYGVTADGGGLLPSGDLVWGVSFRLSPTPLVNRSFTADFDGDGRSDLAVYRPTTGEWFVRTSSSGYAAVARYQWGVTGDIPLAADFDGDHRADLAVYRPSTGEWFVMYSSAGYQRWAVFQWGIANDVPLVADFDGDGKADLVVWRPSTGEWFVRYSSTNYATLASFQWGVALDVPLAADFDGDGKTDLVVFRPSTGVWYVRTSSSRYLSWTSYQWGLTEDVPLVGDFDGDGRTDLAVWRPSTGTWFVRFSSSAYLNWTSYQWGVSTDQPIQADFDGDRRTDLMIWRPQDGTWWTRFSSTGYGAGFTYQWGLTTDRPM